MKHALLMLSLLIPALARAAASTANLITIGQGISSPALTSTVNFSSGYTHESPVGVVYQSSWRLTGEYDADTDGNSKNTGRAGYGAELGYGKAGSAGLAAGYYTRDCDGCGGRVAGSAAVVAGGTGVGVRVQKDLYTAALLFNPAGRHRLGLIAEVNGDNGSGNDLKSYGAGYSYVGGNWTLTVDASKRDYENHATYGKRLLVTPGLMVRASFLHLSVNDKITLQNHENGTNKKDTDHSLWVGVGIGGQDWHLAAYGNYVNDVAAALSFLF